MAKKVSFSSSANLACCHLGVGDVCVKAHFAPKHVKQFGNGVLKSAAKSLISWKTYLEHVWKLHAEIKPEEPESAPHFKST